jgi:hypothetical protein
MTITAPHPADKVWPAAANNFGDEGDYCPECAADWKAPHYQDCSQYLQCGWPPGCTAPAAATRLVCWDHYTKLAALFAPKEN